MKKIRYFTVMNPPVYLGRSFKGIEDMLEDCVCPTVREIMHRHVHGMPQIGCRINEDFDDTDPIIGNGIDEFDLMDEHIHRAEELASSRALASQAKRRAKQEAAKRQTEGQTEEFIAAEPDKPDVAT